MYNCMFVSVGNEENSADCSINDIILPHVKDVKNLRAFGLLLHIDSGKLDRIERSCSNPLTSIITSFNQRVSYMCSIEK